MSFCPFYYHLTTFSCHFYQFDHHIYYSFTTLFLLFFSSLSLTNILHSWSPPWHTWTSNLISASTLIAQLNARLSSIDPSTINSTTSINSTSDNLHVTISGVGVSLATDGLVIEVLPAHLSLLVLLRPKQSYGGNSNSATARMSRRRRVATSNSNTNTTSNTSNTSNSSSNTSTSTTSTTTIQSSSIITSDSTIKNTQFELPFPLDVQLTLNNSIVVIADAQSAYGCTLGVFSAAVLAGKEGEGKATWVQRANAREMSVLFTYAADVGTYYIYDDI